MSGEVAQPMTPNAEDAMEGYVGPNRRRMPSERPGIIHKVTIFDATLGALEGYIVLNKQEDGSLGEIFAHGFGKEGSTVYGMIQWAMVELSIGFQYGMELPMICRKLAHMKFEPRGKTDSKEIPFAHSLPAYMAELIAFHFGDDELRNDLVKIRESLA